MSKILSLHAPELIAAQLMPLRPGREVGTMYEYTDRTLPFLRYSMQCRVCNVLVPSELKRVCDTTPRIETDHAAVGWKDGGNYSSLLRYSSCLAKKNADLRGA